MSKRPNKNAKSVPQQICQANGCTMPAEFDLAGQTKHGRYFCHSHAIELHDCRNRSFNRIDGSSDPALCPRCDHEDDD